MLIFPFDSAGLLFHYAVISTTQANQCQAMMQFTSPDPPTADALGSPPTAAAVVAAVAIDQSSSPQRKRKQASADYLERPVKFGKSPRDITCTREQFESMLEKSYGPRQNNDGIRKSGKDKHGHTLF